MREAAAFWIAAPDATSVIFEGRAEKQEIVTGPIGAPSNAMSMTPSGVHRIVTLVVLRTYRGQIAKSVTVFTGTGAGDCGFDFETGEEYLVDARVMQDGTLFTSICTKTAPLAQAGPAVRVLRGEPPSADDLLDPPSYYAKYMPRWTAKVCGRVAKPDGSPLGGAEVEMSQLRDEPLPLKTVSDENLSKADGSFCVEGIDPGKYLLTAEVVNFKAGSRWMGYYRGVARHSEATPVVVNAGDRLSDLQFRVQEQALYTVRFQIVTADRSPVLWKALGIAILSPDQDALAYSEDHGVNEDGSYTFGLIPAGRYIVSTYLDPDAAAPARWQMARQEVDISGPGQVLITLPDK
jgi:hypothetical protein